jgi:hypothetical protein
LGLRTLSEERPCTGSHWFLSRQRLRRALKGASTGRKSLLDSSDLRLERIVRQRQRHGFGRYPARVARVASSLREGRDDRVKCQSRACYSGEEILAVNWALPRGWYGLDERTPGAFLRRSEPKPLRVFALLEDEALALDRICTRLQHSLCSHELGNRTSGPGFTSAELARSPSATFTNLAMRASDD